MGAAFGCGRAQAAPSASMSVELGGGHDDNMFLAAAPVTSDPLLRLGGWFAAVSPGLVGGLGAHGLRLQASFLGDYRTSDLVGQLYQNQADLGVIVPLGPLRLQLGGSAGRFDASHYPEDRFVFLGGDGGLRLALGDSWRLAGRYRGQWRRLGTTTPSDDRLTAVDAQLAWQPADWIELGPKASLLRVSPTQTDARFTRLRAGLEASLEQGPVALSLDAWAGTIDLAATNERHLGGQLEARWSFGPHIDLVAAVEIAAPISAGATSDYARRVFSLSVVASTSHTWRPAPPRVEDVRPVVQPGRVRFRLKVPTSAQVTVVGSWDDWQTPGRPLGRAVGDDVYEAWLDLPEGSYRYHFLVDGQPQRPPDASRYAPDGFGGEDGVIELAAPPADVARTPRDGGSAVSSSGSRRISSGSEQ